MCFEWLFHLKGLRRPTCSFSSTRPPHTRLGLPDSPLGPGLILKCCGLMFLPKVHAQGG